MRARGGIEHVALALSPLTIHSAPLTGAACSVCWGATRGPRSPRRRGQPIFPAQGEGGMRAEGR